jgi:Na+/H+ antiporter NhaC
MEPIVTPGRGAGPPTVRRPLENRSLRFHGGLAGALLPFVFFVTGVVMLALQGTPDERGFWPILVLALSLGLLLAKDRTTYCEIAIDGMSRPIVMIMVMAWLLASIIGVILTATGFVESLAWAAGRLQIGGIVFVGLTFVICAIVSTSTGTSFGTILIAGPILYPAGVLLGGDPPTLAGAILGGAVFGDNISPISDTTIASASSQGADIGGTVASRLKYAMPAAGLALIAYIAVASRGAAAQLEALALAGDPRGLAMVVVPIVVIALLLSRRHLLHGLLAGVMVGLVVGLAAGMLPPERLLSLDREHFTARSVIIDGIQRGLGISVFTIFLLGLVATLEASGVLRRLVDVSHARMTSSRSAEGWLVGVTSGVVLLTTHSVVAILMAGQFAREAGERFGLHPYRRANLLDVTVCTYPFILPYFIPVILMAGVTTSAAELGGPGVGPLAIGMHNFHSWALLLVLLVAVVTGFGRRFAADAAAER